MGIHIQNLYVRYTPTSIRVSNRNADTSPFVIQDLSIDIPQGSFFTLLGPSGCGKTTLLRTLAGFIQVTNGRILFGNKEVSHVPAHLRDIGFVFQDYALFPTLTVFDNVAYGLRARQVGLKEIKSRVSQALERVGLGEFSSKLPAALSGGQRQRVALARALVIKPSVLMMDEPLSNLDAKLRIHIRETIAELHKEAGITTIFVTHDQEEALALSDYIAIMKQGRIEQVASPHAIYQRPSTTYVANFIGGANIIEGRLQGTSDQSERVIALPGGLLKTKHGDSDLMVNDKVFCVIRPEHWHMSSSPPTETLSLQGRVLSQQFLGFKTHYKVQLTEGVVVSVDMFDSNRWSWTPGQLVYLSCPDEHVLALKE